MLENLWRCDACGHRLSDSEIVTTYVDHPKPGHDRVRLAQCPECGECEQFVNVCDEPGCERDATCGWPTKAADYRRTCYDHMKANEADRAK